MIGSRVAEVVEVETQLYYYKARLYDPTLGRFMQTDPILYVVLVIAALACASCRQPAMTEGTCERVPIDTLFGTETYVGIRHGSIARLNKAPDSSRTAFSVDLSLPSALLRENHVKLVTLWGPASSSSVVAPTACQTVEQDDAREQDELRCVASVPGTTMSLNIEFDGGAATANRRADELAKFVGTSVVCRLPE